MGNVRFTSNIKQWTADTDRKLDVAFLEMATDIHRTSAMLAPKDTRNLVNSGRIERVKEGHYTVSYGGGSVPYARIRHYENNKNPQTLGYLEKAGDSTFRNLKRYTRGL